MRGQSNVVGVVLLLGVTVLALGTLTASIGTMVQSNAATADATQVAADFDAALDPVTVTGVHRGRVAFTDGQVRTVDRELRVLNESMTVEIVHVDALVFTTRHKRVAFLAGAIVRGRGANARMRTRPPITASRSGRDGVLVVGAPELGAARVGASTTGDSITLRSNVTHERTTLGNGTYRVAVETSTPAAWKEFFASQNATVEANRDFDGDGVESVVARYPGRRAAYLVVHDLHLEVANG